METINDRMEILANERYKGNKAAFSKAIGVSPALMSNYLGNKRRSKPSIDLVVKIITSLDVDPYWLLTGTESPNTMHVHTNNSFNGIGNTQVNDNQKKEANYSNDELLNANNEIKLLKQKIEDQNKLLAEKDKVIESKDFIIKVLSANKG